MRAIELAGGFGEERLREVERPNPRPGARQAVVRIRAASLNYRDLLMVRGAYDPRQPLPLIPCSDGAGEVLEVGAEVERVKPGDRVIPLFAQGWLAGAPTRSRVRATLGGPLDGTLAERIVVDAESLVRTPRHLDDREAATLPCAALTAWSALTLPEAVRPGQTVLVEGTGGVAIFALQFAQLFGARVVVISGDPDKLARASALGAWATLDYRATPEWGKAARELTGGEGLDRVVEVGGAATLPQALAAVGFGGQISLIGNLTGGTVSLNLIPVFMRQVRIQGILVGHRESFEAMNRAIEAHALRPVIDREFDFDAYPAAFERLSSQRHVGKICIRAGS